MFRNYLMVAVRNLMRQKLYAGINVLGLAIGMACCLLILLYIQGEMGYNSNYANVERIFKVIRETKTATGTQTFSDRTSGPLGSKLKTQFPKVEDVARLFRRNAWIKTQDDVYPMTLCVSDPNLFSFFNFELVVGDPQSVFRDPQGVVLTETTARRLFGNRNPMGEVVEVEEFSTGGAYTVCGVMKDISPKSTVQFDLVCAVSPTDPFWMWKEWMPTGWLQMETYVLLSARDLATSLEEKMQVLLGQHMGQMVAQYNRYHLHAFDRIYLYSAHDYNIKKAGFGGSGMAYGDLDRLYLAAFIAVAILLIACVNFVNLATARSAKRAREVGLRKAVGASFGNLVVQFLGESLLLTLGAVFVAVGFVEITLPVFGDFVGKPLLFDFWNTPSVLILLLGLVVVVGVFAGGYPAFALSSYRPVDVLKAQSAHPRGGHWLRKVLVVFQFAVSVVLIVGMLICAAQVSYLRNRDLGFDKEAILEVPIFVTASNVPEWGSYGGDLKRQYNRVKEAFLKHPNILAASSARFALGSYSPQSIFQAEGIGDQGWQFRVYPVDEDFISTLNIELIEGSGFSRTHTELDFYERDQKNVPETFILTESAVKQLGWQDPLGKRLSGHQRAGTVIGVVKDFHFQSLKQIQEPAVLVPDFEHLKVLYLKINPAHFEETRAFIEATWKQFLPTRPFKFSFLDDRLDLIYNEEESLERLFTVFALLAIFVGCLGLFGLSSYMTLQRTREIGIRKMLGASVSQVVTLLVRDFAKLIIVAIVIALPVSYYMMTSWLANFPYRIDLTPVPFVAGGFIAFMIALATVMYQAFSAALSDPVDALKCE